MQVIKIYDTIHILIMYLFLRYVLLDTPGQIEVFTWSASGSIITETLVCYSFYAASVRTILLSGVCFSYSSSVHYGHCALC